MLKKVQLSKFLKVLVLLFFVVCNSINSQAQNTKIAFRGFKCFTETNEAGEDEMYFIIQVYSKGQLVKQSRFPENTNEYKGIDKGEYTLLNNKIIYNGPIEDLQIVIISRESDRGSIADAAKSGLDFAVGLLPKELVKLTDPAYLISQLKKVSSPLASVVNELYDVAVVLPNTLSKNFGSTFKSLAGSFYSPGDDWLENKVVLLNKSTLLNDKKTTIKDLGNTAYNFDSDFISGDGGAYKCYFAISTIPPPKITNTDLPKNILFYNFSTSTGVLTDSKAFGTISKHNFNRWSNIVDLGNNKVLFYNYDGLNAVTNNNNFETIKQYRFSGGWTHILTLGSSQVLFYNQSTGANALTNKNNDFATIKQYGFAKGWTKIVELGNKTILFYNQTNGLAAIGTIAANGDFAQIKSLNLDRMWTHIVSINLERTILYNTVSGKGMLVDNNLNKIKDLPFSAGWTSIVPINDTRILFYNQTNGANLLSDENFKLVTKYPFSSKWSNIIPFK
jgi:hypothetical protein